MARRRTQVDGCTSVLALGIAAGLLGGVVLVAGLVVAHPVISIVGFLAIAAAAVTGVVLRYRSRARAELARATAARQAYELEVIRSQEIARYHMMGAPEFEEALAFLCARDGCAYAERVGRAGDLGADVIATAPDGRKIVIQAKRYVPTNKVTGPDLQRFGGTCYSVHGAHIAAVITTSTFTQQARQYAAHHGIRLFDADALAAWASRTGPAPWH
ncbi:restriction endonuclease [Amycolatopsis benzoatilytica]|uniref:restriction endonuclease n=1 Tax=Amycolatopsis benzoatilytica TaxID=346045 RepID=UPI00039D91CF|nr:restriction endonuclease [Amycolatopsis benzoatilytica]